LRHDKSALDEVSKTSRKRIFWQGRMINDPGGLGAARNRGY
jgi:hypothetical protein